MSIGKLTSLKPSQKLVLAVSGCTLLVVMLTSVSVAAAYHNRFLPNSRIAGLDAGGLSATEVASALDQKLESTKIKFIYQDSVVEASAKDIGIEYDLAALEISTSGSRLAGLKFFRTNNLPLNVSISRTKLADAIAELDKVATQPAQNAVFIYTEQGPVIEPDVVGFGINYDDLSSTLETSISTEIKDIQIELTSQELEPKIRATDLAELNSEMAEFIAMELSIKALDITVSPSGEDKFNWLKLEGEGKSAKLAVDKEKVDSYVKAALAQLNRPPEDEIIFEYKSGKQSKVSSAGVQGITVVNGSALADSLYAAAQSKQPQVIEPEIKLTNFGTETKVIDDIVREKSYTYSVEVWGSINADLAELKAQVNETLNSPSGWARAKIKFREVASGGSLTIVVAEPARVASASPVCDAYYNCRVGRNVIINDDRWMYATPQWNSAGLSLRGYRHMLLNHEMGHWLGLGHVGCQAVGGPASIMQQQSSNLGGCTFNAWPLDYEINKIAN